ncbi:MAG: LysM peptidoglycan-binding domain-containing protein [Firmicutes bacterium]|nr:LysM peptidoglycan-binding domain-containing protein [Bacillota bacterium]
MPPRRRYYPPRYGYGCPAGTTPYYVRYGDTAWGIAQEFGVDIDDLADANPGVDLNSLDVGERLCIPR